MKVVIQRVHNATILINKQESRSIRQGLVVYIGISKNAIENAEQNIQKLITRLLNIGIFADDQGKLKQSLKDIQGEILLVSNFTLHGKNKKGNQIDFGDAAAYKDAENIYDKILTGLQEEYDSTKIVSGRFGAYMEITSTVDGPVNLVIDL